MTDAEHRKLKKDWTRIMGFWDPVLNLSEYNIKLQWHSDPFDCSTEEDWRTAALTMTSWRYAESTIRIDSSACAQLSDDELEELIVHELLHIKTSVLMIEESSTEHTSKANQAEERMCTDLARALINARKAGVKLGQRAKK